MTDAAAGDAAATVTALGGSGASWQGARIAGPRDAVVVWPAEPGAKTLAYTAPRAPRMTHVVIDPPSLDDRVVVASQPSGDGCAIEITGDNAATAWPARPLVFVVDANCAASLDRAAAAAPSAAHTKAPHAAAHSARGGCCDAGGAAPSGCGALALAVLGLVRRRRSR